MAVFLGKMLQCKNRLESAIGGAYNARRIRGFPLPAAPSFLIVGAMKAGTTTLYRDLLLHPDIFLPSQKEPDTLVRYVNLDDIRRDYADLFRRARSDQAAGEASTTYTKRPTYEGAAERALAVCGPDLKIIYITRDPLERTISHYRHESAHGTISGTFAEAIRHYPRLVDYSRYDWQIAPWREAFGDNQILRVSLEEFSANRRVELIKVLRFLNLDPTKLGEIDEKAIANQANEVKRLTNPVLQAMITSVFYQRRIRSLFSAETREKIRRTILPAMKVDEIVIDDETLRLFRRRLAQVS